LGLAWRLSTHGVNVCLLEAAPEVGGLAGTLREDGFCMDMGPHSFFSEDEGIRDTVLKLFDNHLAPKPRQVKFHYQGKFLDYPLTPYGVLFQMGVGSGICAGLSFIKSKLTPRGRRTEETDDESVEEWAVNSFGRHLYRTFFKPYTEQFWKVPCTELSSRTIPTHTRMSFINTCRLLIRRRLSKIDPSLVEREMLPTYYPDSGFQEIAEKTAAAAEAAGAEIRVSSRAVGVDVLPDNGVRVRYEHNGQADEIRGTHLASTLPLDVFVPMLNPAPPADVAASAASLDYRSLVALGMVTERQQILGCSYMYVLNRPYNRISEMNEFSPHTSPPGDNIVVVEIPCLRGSAAWTAPKEELFDMCIQSLAQDGFLSPGDVKRLLLVRMPHAYPIYRRNYAPHLERVLGYLGEHPRLFALGRCGEFMYMDVDRCMRHAFELADEMTEKHGWAKPGP